jgi:divalent metal cation (Fe/Co/Zn/Cd) transporter
MIKKRMTDISFITDKNGSKTHLLLPLKSPKKITLEYIEDIQDIIAYELLKNDESVDYKSNIETIINKKKKLDVSDSH